MVKDSKVKELLFRLVFAATEPMIISIDFLDSISKMVPKGMKNIPHKITETLAWTPFCRNNREYLGDKLQGDAENYNII